MIKKVIYIAWNSFIEFLVMFIALWCSMYIFRLSVKGLVLLVAQIAIAVLLLWVFLIRPRKPLFRIPHTTLKSMELSTIILFIIVYVIHFVLLREVPVVTVSALEWDALFECLPFSIGQAFTVMACTTAGDDSLYNACNYVYTSNIPFYAVSLGMTVVASVLEGIRSVSITKEVI